MKTQSHFKIVILEDSEFYNNILSKKLENYIKPIAIDKKYSFDIQSYTNLNDCLYNLHSDTDIAFVDFYLGDSKNALYVLKKIKQKCLNCKVVIISQSKNSMTELQTISEGAVDFISKDNDALMRSCYIAEDIINERLNVSSL
ncbi:MAG TPA: response regulator [Bacteroidia bacterium]|nr:response regulator [Bacteroidia bacterium]